MGRHKLGFNAESRKVVAGKFLDGEKVKQLQNKVTSLHPVDRYGMNNSTDDSNALVLPGKKRQFRKNREPASKGKILSRKRRKVLEKIVEQKKKKMERGELLSKLKEVQISSEELEKMTSISAIQTKGLKRQIAEDEWMEQMDKEGHSMDLQTINPTKKQKLKNLLPKRLEETRDDILGFDSSSATSEDESEEEILSDEEGKEMLVAMKDSQEKSNQSQSKIVESFQKQEKSIMKRPPTKLHPLPILTSFPSYVSVLRLPSIQASRERLPIIAEEQIIMEAINENPVVILAGETGSGKTTQVPQFLYEAGYTRHSKLIGITEPRRVAAMAMAKRVGEELNMPEKVSYAIRFEGNVTDETQIKFMTDGVLLREMSKDFRLRKYSVIIIDEAHERSVFTDILIGNLSRIVPMRQNDKENGPLRLIIMSATLRVSDFTDNKRLFKSIPPCIKVESRQFPTTCHFQRVTPDDYILAALKKSCKIHQELPEGGILIFVTGQQEVNQLVRKLRKLFPSRNLKDSEEEKTEESIEQYMLAFKKPKRRGERTRDMLSPTKVIPRVNLDNYRAVPLDDSEADALRDLEEDEDLLGDEDDELLTNQYTNCQPMWTLPLYSLLNSEKQARIFDPVPVGHRLCVVATNLAETSLTIPGIKYVVDTGKVKTKFHDRLTGVTSFQVTWTSKAGANQRAGRAGRQGPGHCYRLYSSEVFNSDFLEHSEPEITKKPVDDLVLQMKAMKIINVGNFPFPTPPNQIQLNVAEQKLLALGALAFNKESKFNVITELGKSMSAIPIAPCFAKMLALSEQHELMPYSIALVSALTVHEVLIETPVGSHSDCFNNEEVSKIRKIWAGRGNSFLLGDPMLLIKAVCASENDSRSLADFCSSYSLRFKAVMEIRKLRRQLTNEINMILPRLNLVLAPKLSPPSDQQALLLRQIILSGMVNNVARKVEVEEEVKDLKIRAQLKFAYKCGSLEEPAFLHSSSIFVQKSKVEKLPEWIVYQEIFETDKLYLRGITAIEPDWLPTFARSQCHFLPPCQDPEPWYEEGQVMCRMKGTFGPQAWSLPALNLPYPGAESINYFARFLLEGKVCKELEQFSDQLLCSPSTFIRSTSFHGETAKAFLNRLAEENVNCAHRLKEMFVKDKEFLKAEFKRFVPKIKHADVEAIWPPTL